MKTVAGKRKNTIDGLAGEVRKGFAAMNGRFVKTDASIEKLARLVVEGFADVNEQYEELKSTFQSAEKRIQALEMKVGGIYKLWEEEKLQRLDVSYLLQRIARLEQKVFDS